MPKKSVFLDIRIFYDIIIIIVTVWYSESQPCRLGLIGHRSPMSSLAPALDELHFQAQIPMATISFVS